MGGWLDQLEIMLPQPNLSWDWAELGNIVGNPVRYKEDYLEWRTNCRASNAVDGIRKI